MRTARKHRPRTSVIVRMHYVKLVFRSLLFIAATLLYVINRIRSTGEAFGGYEDNHVLLGIIWVWFMTEMVLRLFPSRIESMGCQKQFARNHRPTASTVTRPRVTPPVRTLLTAAVWLALNAVVGLLYFLGVIDEGILVLICLAYSICDVICILFFCPFQTWFLQNKCCNTCRIYNWDYAMMCTPLVFFPNPYTWSLLAVSLIILVKWELLLHRHPERFSPETNASLSCLECKEKLCHHKKQLRSLLQKQRKRMRLLGKRGEDEPHPPSDTTPNA